MVSRILFVLIIATCSSVSIVQGQWQNIAPGLIGSRFSSIGGAMEYKYGILLAGMNTLKLSTDDGVTWTNRSPGFGYIMDIDIFDANTFAITLEHEAYFTQDQGITWTTIHSGASGYYKAIKFLGAKNKIMIATESSGMFRTSDGGVTWVNVKFTEFPEDIVYFADGTPEGLIELFAYSDDFNGYGSLVHYSTDGGVTWLTNNGYTAYDTYSFAVDPSDHNRILVANEDSYATANNGFGEMFLSTDRGTSWKITYSAPIQSICGNVIFDACGKAYIQSQNGVMVSSDGGESWNPISGPGGLPDQRLLAITPNGKLFAADNNGSIYMTDVGQSISFSFSKFLLFETDTVALCENAVMRSFDMQAGRCRPVSVIKTEFVPPLPDYTLVTPITGPVTDTQRVDLLFKPSASGYRPSVFRITLDDNSVHDISLGGNGAFPRTLTLATRDLATDTIGGTVEVPISVVGLYDPEDIELVIRYDSGTLDYLGTSASDGTSFDLAGEAWGGRAKIRIPAAYVLSANPSGYARFFVYVDSTGSTPVTFDSLVVITPVSCLYLPTPATTSMIGTVSGCGAMQISNFVFHGSIPTLSIFPNPTMRDAVIATNLRGDAAVDVYDELGRRVLHTALTIIHPETPLGLGSLPPGTYLIRIGSQGVAVSAKLLIAR